MVAPNPDQDIPYYKSAVDRALNHQDVAALMEPILNLVGRRGYDDMVPVALHLTRKLIGTYQWRAADELLKNLSSAIPSQIKSPEMKTALIKGATDFVDTAVEHYLTGCGTVDGYCADNAISLMRIFRSRCPSGSPELQSVDARIEYLGKLEGEPPHRIEQAAGQAPLSPRPQNSRHWPIFAHN